MADLGKVINGLECCILHDPDDKQRCSECTYAGNCVNRLKQDALSLLKAQGEVIDALLKVGCPHNFQREPRWIVNYMYAITDVVKKAGCLRNGET